MAAPKGYTSDLAAATNYYQSVLGRLAANAASQSGGGISATQTPASNIPASWTLLSNASQGSSGGSASSPSTDSGDTDTRPDYLKHPHNPYDWTMSKLTDGHNPVSKAFMALSDPNKGVGRIVDTLAQPMYDLAQTGLEGDEVKYRDEQNGVSAGKQILDVLGTDLKGLVTNFGGGNAKITPSDTLRHSQEVADKYLSTKKNGGSAEDKAYATDRIVNGKSFVNLKDNPEDNAWTRLGKFGTGLGIDIAADPLTYVPGGAIKAVVASPIKGVVKGSEALQASDRFAQEGSKLGNITGDVLNFNDKLQTASARRSAQTVANSLGVKAAKAAKEAGATKEAQKAASDAAKSAHMRDFNAQAAYKPLATSMAKDVQGATPVEGELGNSNLIRDNSLEVKAANTEGLAATEGVSEALAKQASKEAKAAGEVVEHPPIAAEDAWAQDHPGTAFDDQAPTQPNMMYNPRTGETAPLDMARVLSEKVAVSTPKYGNKVFKDIGDLYPVGPKRYEAAVAKEQALADAKAGETAAAKASEYAAGEVDDVGEFGEFASVSDQPVMKQVTEAISQARKDRSRTPASIREQLTAYKTAALQNPKIAKAFQDFQDARRGSEGLDAGEAGTGAVPGVSGGAEPAAPDVVKGVLDRMAKLRARDASRRRLTNPKAIQNWVQRNSWLDEADLNRLLEATNPKSFSARASAIIRQTTKSETNAWQPFYREVMDAQTFSHTPEIADVLDGGEPALIPDNFIDDAKTGLVQAGDQIKAALSHAPSVGATEAIQTAASGAGVSQITKTALARAIGKAGDDWLDARKDLVYETPTGVKRTDPTKWVGEGVVKNGWNRITQRNFVASIFEQLSAEAAVAARAGGKVNPWDYSRYMEKHVPEYLREGEQFLMANGVAGTVSTASQGVPLWLSQVIDGFSQTREGRDLLKARFFNGYSLKSSKNGADIIHGDELVTLGQNVGVAPGLVEAEALMNIAEQFAQRVGSKVTDAKNVEKALGKQADKFAKKIYEEFTIHQDEDFGPEMEAIREAVMGVKRDAKTGEIIEEKTLGVRNRTAGQLTRVPAHAEALVANHVLGVMMDPRIIRRIYQHIHNNAGLHGIQTGRTVAAISKDTMEKVLGILDDPLTSNRDAVRALTDTDKVAKTVPSAQSGFATKEFGEMAATMAQNKLGEVVPDLDVQIAKLQKSVSEDAGKEVGGWVSKMTNSRTQTKFDISAKSSLEEMAKAQLLDPDHVSDVVFNTGVFKMMDGMARKFTKMYGNATMSEALLTSGSLVGSLSARLHGDLRDLTMGIRDYMGKAGLKGHEAELKLTSDLMKAVQKGTVDQLAPEIQEFGRSMKAIIDHSFDTGSEMGQNSILSTFFREGFDLDHLNFALRDKKYEFPEGFQFNKKGLEETGKTTKKGKPITTEKEFSKEEIADQWTKWEIEDPLDFIDKMNAITTRVATDVGTAKHFWRLASDHGLASTKPRPGFVKVPANLMVKDKEGKEFNSFLGKYLMRDSKDTFTYVHPDALRELRRMDNILKESYTTTGFDKMMNKYLDPGLQMWKSGMTVWRPGHHVRNLIGDLSISYLQDGIGPKTMAQYYRAIKIAAGKQKGVAEDGTRLNYRDAYGTWDAQQALQRVEKAVRAGQIDDPEILKAIEEGDAPLKFSSKSHGDYAISRQNFHNELMDRGMLPTFKTQEDLTFGDPLEIAASQKSMVQKLANKAHDNGISRKLTKHKFVPSKEKIGRFTEGRDDFVRLGHAMDLLDRGIDGKPWTGTPEEILDQIAARVKLAHPDGTSLTPFEARYMKRVFPFYSWFRAATPNILLNTVIHPGRALVYPKAMYNYAESHGVDLDSLSNPFPDDQFFPNFINQNMTGVTFKGPKGDYFSVDPGIAQADILNTFAAGGPSGTYNGIAGMLNPLIKAPIELATGSRLDALGQDVSSGDPADYIDQEIPGVGSIATLTGRSPTKTVSNFFTGKGAGLAPTSAQAKEDAGQNTRGPEWQYILNNLLGAKITDDSQSNYQTIGNMQEAARIKAAANRWQRN